MIVFYKVWFLIASLRGGTTRQSLAYQAQTHLRLQNENQIVRSNEQLSQRQSTSPTLHLLKKRSLFMRFVILSVAKNLYRGFTK